MSPSPPSANGRITIDGKFFRLGAQRFTARGVTYGTFAPRADGARFPQGPRIRSDLAAMRRAGFNVVRTYTEPTDDLVRLAAEHELHLFTGIFYEDWRYLIGASRRQRARIGREARDVLRKAATRLAGNEQVFALTLGNEIPADVVRWVGTSAVAGLIEELADECRAVDPDLLLTYANYPTAEYLRLDTLDFLTFNVYLERQADLRRYLNRLHTLARDRPLVLGEVGAHADPDDQSERAQAEAIGWQLETALERGTAGTCVFSWTDEWHVGEQAVEGWRFGLTRADRSAKPALEVARRWNRRTVADLDAGWPSISVVVCAYNAQATLDECLRHCASLDYPELEVIVVDDGSTDSTAAIAHRYPRVRLVEIEHAGLSAARNAGHAAARHDLVAYLDSDAYPTPEWPYYLALGLDARDVGGVGGPNVAPVDDPPSAQAVACAPGGPVPVLIGDDRAEHVPGCNMAFWRTVLDETGGFDPVYTAAGDDVDICWKVIDGGWRIGFHPAALVWHHRRPGTRAYLRQQRGYGRAETLVAARHPHRFTRLGTARWHGFIYQPGAATGPGRTYRGAFGGAAFQSVYRTPSHAWDVAHQVGTPIAVAAAASAPLAAIDVRLGIPALAGLLFLLGLFGVDIVRAHPPVHHRRRAKRFRAHVALLRMLQPLARTWGRISRAHARRPRTAPSLPGPVSTTRHGVMILPADRPRPRLSELAVSVISAAGIHATPDSSWSDVDATLHGSSLVRGRLLSSAFPEGAVQMRVRLQWRWGRSLAIAGAAAIAGWRVGHIPAFAILTAGCVESLRGVWRVGPRTRRAIVASASATALLRPEAAVDPSERWAAPVTFELPVNDDAAERRIGADRHVLV